MKTEGLTWAEAIKAYANGERIKSSQGVEYWLDENSNPFTGQTGCREYEHRLADFFPSMGPFSIVKPEPKKLSFDEAVKAWLDEKTLTIHAPDGNRLISSFCDDWRRRSYTELFLDLAERRGWPITLAEEE